MTANLQPGEYDMTCGLLTNPKGKLIVKGSATADAAQSDALLSLSGAITEYKTYVTAETAQLVAGTKAFTDAIKAGDLEKRNRCTRQPVSIMNVLNRLLNCSPISTAASMRVKMIMSKNPPIPNSPASTARKRCLATIPLKVWTSMPTN